MGAASASGESLVEVGNSALYTTTSQELERTPGSAGNVDKFTFSAWCYFTQPTTSSSTPIFGAINTSANQHRILKTNTGQLQHDLYLSNSFVGRLITTQLLRDQAWYHIVAVYDSGNAIAGDRMMLYLNGERITDFATDTNPSQNLDGLICGAHLHQLGFHDGLSLSLNGYMAETVLLDGTVADPNSFGQYDSTGTFWTPKSSAEIKALTFGTTGFYLDNTTNAQTDASGEGNNFTNTGSVALSTHTPTQLWPIFNSLSIGASSGVTDGNTKVTYGDAGANYSIISFPGTGKFVAQCTADDVVSNGIGWVALNADGGVSTSNALVLNEARWIGLTGGNWIHSQYVDFVGGTNLGTVKTSASDGDILQLEWDNGTLTVQINGTRYTPSNWTAVDTSLNWAFLSRCAGNGTETWDFGQDGFTPHDTSYSYVNTTTLASAITRTKSNLEEYFDTTLYEGNGAERS